MFQEILRYWKSASFQLERRRFSFHLEKYDSHRVVWAQIGQYHTWIFLGSPNLAGYEMLFGVLKMSGWNEFLHPHVRGTYPRANPSRRLSTFDDGQNMPIPQSLNLYVGSPMWCRKPCLPIANLSSRISQRQIHARPAQTFIAQRQRLESRTSEERLQLG